jgi:hypothetical protein
MNAPASDDIMRQVAAQTEKELDALGQKMADWMKKLIGVPVVRARIPGTRRLGKAVIIRSQPGEPPRKDTGRLQASVHHLTYRVGWKVKLVVSANTPYAHTVNRTRPYREITENYWKNQVEIRLAYSFR